MIWPPCASSQSSRPCTGSRLTSASRKRRNGKNAKKKKYDIAAATVRMLSSWMRWTSSEKKRRGWRSPARRVDQRGPASLRRETAERAPTLQHFTHVHSPHPPPARPEGHPPPPPPAPPPISAPAHVP